MIVKAITYMYEQDGHQNQKVVGVYSSKEISKGIEEVKEGMIALGRKIIREEKDCCNYFLEFSGGDYGKECFYTGDYILNELNL